MLTNGTFRTLSQPRIDAPHMKRMKTRNRPHSLPNLILFQTNRTRLRFAATTSTLLMSLLLMSTRRQQLIAPPQHPRWTPSDLRLRRTNTRKNTPNRRTALLHERTQIIVIIPVKIPPVHQMPQGIGAYLPFAIGGAFGIESIDEPLELTMAVEGAGSSTETGGLARRRGEVGDEGGEGTSPSRVGACRVVVGGGGAIIIIIIIAALGGGFVVLIVGKVAEGRIQIVFGEVTDEEGYEDAKDGAHGDHH